MLNRLYRLCQSGVCHKQQSGHCKAYYKPYYKAIEEAAGTARLSFGSILGIQFSIFRQTVSGMPGVVVDVMQRLFLMPDTR